MGTAITAALSQLASAEYQASIKAQVAPLTLSEITDGLVNIYGILWDPATTHSSVSIRIPQRRRRTCML